MIKDRVTVQEAAKRLGVKDDAIRKRIQRGTLEHDKDPDGRVYVYLDATEEESYDGQSGARTQPTSQDATQDAIVLAKDETISELRDQVDFLRRELERKERYSCPSPNAFPSWRPRLESQHLPRRTRRPQEGLPRTENGSGATPVDRESQNGSGVREKSWFRRLFGG